MEQRIINIENDISELKGRFKQQETLLESVAASIFRLEKGQMRLEAMLQHLYFRDFDAS